MLHGLADRLSSRGYVGLAPAIFHREGRMTMGRHEELPSAIDRMSKCTADDILADLRAAVDYLKAQPFVQGDRIGIVGFCFGGRISYLAAANIHDISAAVVYYGSAIPAPFTGGRPSPLKQTANISPAVLGLFGEGDANPTPADVANI